MYLMRKMAPLAMLIGSLTIVGYLAIREAESLVDIFRSVPKLSVQTMPVTYSADYVKAEISGPVSMTYTRYERKGFDGEKYCMQELDTPDAKMIDGISNSCDDTIDALVILEEYQDGVYGEIRICGDDEGSGELCMASNDFFKAFIGTTKAKNVLDYWNLHRQDCIEKSCFAKINFLVIQ